MCLILYEKATPSSMKLAISLCLLALLNSIYSQEYGTTCSTAGNLDGIVGAGFAGLISSPYSQSWLWNPTCEGTGCDVCTSSYSALNSTQQWVWYSFNAGAESFFYFSTSGSDNAIAIGVDTLIWTSADCSTKKDCNNNYPGAKTGKSKLTLTSTPTSGALRLAIGQYVPLTKSAVDALNGKSYVAQYCVSSCSACSGLPAKLFSPNKAAPYNTITTGSSISPSCGAIHKPNYYVFTAPSNGTVLISTCPSDGATKSHTLTTRIAVYTSCSSSSIVCATGDSSCSNSANASFSVTQGMNYTVAIGTTTATVYDGTGDSNPLFVFTCAAGTYDHDNNQNTPCVPCTPVPGCISALTCSNSSNSVCTSCQSGYYLSNGVCSVCTLPSNCNAYSACTASSNHLCTSCNGGYFLKTGTCSVCSSKTDCQSVICSTQFTSTCTLCSDGYYLNSGSCAACTPVPNCNSTLTCTTSSNSVCTSCVSGYYLNSGTCTACTPIPNCNNSLTCSTAFNSVCTSCVSGYYLNSGACTACTPVSNCSSPITCSTSSNSICTSCHNGTYLNTGGCLECTTVSDCTSALTCSNSNNSICTFCHTGFYLDHGACSACSVQSNCTSVVCSNSTNSICTACSNGYKLSNGNCILRQTNKESVSSLPIPVVVGAAVGGVVFLCLIIILAFFVRKRKKSSKRINNTTFSLERDLSNTYNHHTQENSIPMQYINRNSGELSSVTTVSTLSTSTIIPVAVEPPLPVNRSIKPNPKIPPKVPQSIPKQQQQQQTQNDYDILADKSNDRNTYDSIVSGNSAYDSAHFPSVYTIEGVTYTSPIFSNPPSVYRKTTPLKFNHIYASTIVMTSPVHPPTLHRKDLRLLQEIGSGEFASVYSGQMPEHWRSVSSNNSSNSIKQPTLPPKPETIKQKQSNCAVKQLKENSGQKTETDFIEEGKLMLEMDHPNIVKAFALFTDAQPYLTVLEMLEYGDLLKLLQACPNHNIFLYPHEFLYIIAQISSGMRYLAEKPLIHRDLAARNVLVGPDLLLKISDFGLSRQMFEEKDYYKMNSDGKLPTRWMAPESLNMRKFSTASDVWSFGVTCWEIYSYGGFPYANVPNMEIPIYLESNERLPCPPDCPFPIYELLLQCWNWDEYERPIFSEISIYLEAQQTTTNAPVRDIGALVYYLS